MRISCILSLVSSVWLSAALSAADRPNILWITSEDNSSQWIGCYGNSQARTPTLDSLAEEGVLFERAYSNAPVCAVARSTILRGAYAPTTGTQHMRSRHPIPARYKPYVSYLRELGYYCTNTSKTDYNFKGNDNQLWDESGKKASYRKRPEGAPFFSIINLTVCHESSLFPKREMKPQRLTAEEVVIPPYVPDLPEMRTDFARYHDRITEMDTQVGGILKQLEKDGLADDTIIFYYADHGGPTPRGKRYLKDTGVRVPMIVKVPEKWRRLSPFKVGERSEEIVSFVDLAPTLLSLTGLETPAQMQGRAFLGEHRADPGNDEMAFLFADRFDELYGMRRGLTDGRWKYIRRFAPHRSAAPYSFYQFSMPSWAAWRTAWQEGSLSGTHRAIWEAPQACEELYDLKSDPWEIKNLADDPSQTAKLAELRGLLKSKMAEVHDTGVVPEPMFEHLAGSKPIADFVQGADFEMEADLDLAFIASARDPKNLPLLVKALKSENPVARYWAVAGLLILGEESKSEAAALEGLLEDPQASIRTTAAEALAVWGRRDEAQKLLLAQLDQQLDEWSMLNVLSTLRSLEMLSAVSTEWAESKKTDDKYVGRFAVEILNERR